MERKPKWARAERIERELSFDLKSAPPRIFPLLCPVREYEWIPDWRCVMLYADSGAAEKDAVFLTREAFGQKTVWCCITYEPPLFIEYLLVLSRGAVVRLSIRLGEAAGGSTRVTWTMRFTVSRLMSHLAAKVTSREGFEAMIGARQRQLERFLAMPEPSGT